MLEDKEGSQRPPQKQGDGAKDGLGKSKGPIQPSVSDTTRPLPRPKEEPPVTPMKK